MATTETIGKFNTELDDGGTNVGQALKSLYAFMSSGTDSIVNNKYDVFLFGGMLSLEDNMIFDSMEFGTLIHLGAACENVQLPAYTFDMGKDIFLDPLTRETFSTTGNVKFENNLTVIVRDNEDMGWYKLFCALYDRFFNVFDYSVKNAYQQLHAVVNVYNLSLGGANGDYAIMQSLLFHSISIKSLSFSPDVKNGDSGEPIKYQLVFNCGVPIPLSTKTDEKGVHMLDANWTDPHLFISFDANTNADNVGTRLIKSNGEYNQKLFVQDGNSIRQISGRKGG